MRDVGVGHDVDAAWFIDMHTNYRDMEDTVCKTHINLAFH
jgi:hypothetical protein